jgi:predicted dinucleotide-binding enzyme
MRIGILGKGAVGLTLARLWADLGHGVAVGCRDPLDGAARRAVRTAGASVETVSLVDAIRGSEVAVLAVPWPSARAVAALVDDWAQRVLLDCVNPIRANLDLDVGHGTSAAEQIASSAHGARVVKALNAVGAARLGAPSFGGQRSHVPICGDDDGAKRVVRSLVEDLGFDVVDAGSLESARYLEALAVLSMRIAAEGDLGANVGLRFLTDERE